MKQTSGWGRKKLRDRNMLGEEKKLDRKKRNTHN